MPTDNGFAYDREGLVLSNGGTGMNDGNAPGSSMEKNYSEVEITYLKYGFYILCLALFVVTVIFLAFLGYMIRFERLPSHDAHAAATSVVGVIGTLVGFFFGHHAAALSKVRAERAEKSSLERANALRGQKEQVVSSALTRLRSLDGEEAERFLDEVRQIETGASEDGA